MRRLALLLISAALLSGCAFLPPEPEPEAIDVTTPVTTKRETVPARRAPIEVRVQMNATVGAERQQSLYVKSGGRVKQVHVQVGDKVAAGQTLLELESGTLPYDVALAQLGLKRMQLTLDALHAKKGFVDEPSPLDLARAELDVQQAELQLAQKQEALGDTRLLAPFEGQVMGLSVSAGDQVQAFTAIMVVGGLTDLVVRSTANDMVASQLQVGQPAYIFPNDGNPAPVLGKIVAMPTTVMSGSDNSVVIAPLEASTRLRAGQWGRVEVVTQRQENALVIPKSAVRTFSGRQFVTVVDGQTRLEVSVTLGLVNDTLAEVTDGLNPGDQVLVR